MSPVVQRSVTGDTEERRRADLRGAESTGDGLDFSAFFGNSNSRPPVRKLATAIIERGSIEGELRLECADLLFQLYSCLSQLPGQFSSLALGCRVDVAIGGKGADSVQPCFFSLYLALDLIGKRNDRAAAAARDASDRKTESFPPLSGARGQVQTISDLFPTS